MADVLYVWIVLVLRILCNSRGESVTDVNMQWGLFNLILYNHTNSVFYIILFCVLHFIEC